MMLNAQDKVIQTFDWKDFFSWSNQIENSIFSFFTKSEFTEIFKNSDNPISEISEGILDKISDMFWGQFSDIKVYHASKPVIPMEIHNNGLHPLNAVNFINLFKEIFPFRIYNITDEDLEYSLKQIGVDVRDGFLYVVLDDRIFEDGCGHYLVHGSEFLLTLTVNLPQHIDSISMTNVLLERGVPTIFEICFPIEKVDSVERKNLIYDILTEWWYMNNHSDPIIGIIDYSFCLEEAIESDYIINHYHPKSIKNPHYTLYGPEIYESEEKCSMCTKNNFQRHVEKN